jgi:hypothetical protein
VIDAVGHAPFEDVGGIGGWGGFLEAMANPDHEDHDRMAEWAKGYEPGIEFDPARVDIVGINAQLRERIVHVAERTDEPPVLGVEEASGMVAPFIRLLELIGAEGLRLTQAGKLPPAVVEDLADALDISDWIGKRNREDLTYPVAALRRSATQTGLVRLSRGTLYRTKTAERLMPHPVRLVEHLVSRAIPRKQAWIDTAAALLFACAVGRGVALSQSGAARLVATGLTSLGWRMATGGPVSSDGAVELTGPLGEIFGAAGVWGRTGWRHQGAPPTPAGVYFARAVVAYALPEPFANVIERERREWDE